ncbi:methionine--tRNA ligase [Ureaplasma miroungigenitalium]|uniref:Methionine--tRNA ligase n=1 Tax=Ureaplasma miroungigenitalium TaxID=1042321 RepID=A0ABT3BNB7_9BACT|nr:methionine--tRNA ligase [Ureaplasma miroungigenitalium]MCV3728647.1 methionine--tRNA ligase [Ureaplasma miroungigenitalium]MCV3734338.1 methionine--tRNA ligase [Ureaplasma miroungigenitalium]
MSQKFFISTPIYYPSGKPHIGHAYSTIIADVLAKYKKLFGYETFFVTGVDEHGQKIQTKAKEANMSEQAYVDLMQQSFVDLWTRLQIDYDCFIRTTNKNHVQSVQKIFSQLYKQNKIYLDEWVGNYCVSCEENINDADVVINSDNQKTCHFGHLLEQKKEASYFYKMKESTQFLMDYYAQHPDFIVPKERVNELINNFLQDLNDLSISRTTFNWGVPILENPEHVIYVWLDALMNYVTATGYLTNDDHLFQKFWNDDKTEVVHLLSKEITRFHCIYWPIFLHDLGIRLPSKILSHGWIITKEGKMSKSLGNVVDPHDLIDRFGADVTRYYLLADLSMYKDSVFSYDNLIETYNTHLANNFGNMVSRTLGMLKKYNSNIIRPVTLPKDLTDQLDQFIKQFIDQINLYQIDKALMVLQNLLDFANKYIEEKKPWELFKNDDIAALDELLYFLTKVVHICTILYQPILQTSTQTVAQQMNFTPEMLTFKKLRDYHLFNNHEVGTASPIFQRIVIEK